MKITRVDIKAAIATFLTFGFAAVVVTAFAMMPGKVAAFIIIGLMCTVLLSMFVVMAFIGYRERFGRNP